MANQSQDELNTGLTEELETDELETEGLEEDDEENQTSEEEANQSQEEEFDIIKYNHQEVKIPVSERQTYLQKGYHYDSVRTERDRAVAIAKLLGFKSLDEMESAARQKIKEETGRDPLEIEEAVNSHPMVKAAEKKALESKPYFKELEAEIDAFVEENPSWSYEQAYIYCRGLKHEELLKKELEMKEKRTLANVQDRGKKKVDTGQTETKPEAVLSKTQIALAKEFGVPLNEVAKRATKRK